MQFWEKNITPWPLQGNMVLEMSYKQYLYPNKLQIGVILGCVFIIIQAFVFSESSLHKKKKIVNGILDHFIKDKFKGETEKYRITVFKKTLGLWAWKNYIFKCFIYNWKEHKKKKLLTFYLKGFPSPWKYYLIQIARNGHPVPNGSSTKFLFPTKESEITGIAAFSAFRDTAIRKELPWIDEQLVHNIDALEGLKSKQKKDILLYIKDGKLGSFPKLKSMHRYPNRIFATPIRLLNESIWGVIVFDCNDPNRESFENQYQDFVDYCRVIESVTKNLN